MNYESWCLSTKSNTKPSLKDMIFKLTVNSLIKYYQGIEGCVTELCLESQHQKKTPRKMFTSGSEGSQRREIFSSKTFFPSKNCDSRMAGSSSHVAWNNDRALLPKCPPRPIKPASAFWAQPRKELSLRRETRKLPRGSLNYLQNRGPKVVNISDRSSPAYSARYSQ